MIDEELGAELSDGSVGHQSTVSVVIKIKWAGRCTGAIVFYISAESLGLKTFRCN